MHFRRRTYALGFGLLAVFGTAFTVFYHPSKVEIEAVMVFAFLSVAMYGAAVGGWTGVTGAFIVDALVSGSVCILLWIVLFKILRVQNMRPSAKH